MIKVDIRRNSDNEILSFVVKGHAGYDENGKDIICAAASAIAYTAIGYIDEFYKVKDDKSFYKENDGCITFERPIVKEYDSIMKINAVLEAMVVGFKQIENSYGYKYLKVRDEEVQSNVKD